MKTALIVHGTCSREEYFSDNFPSPSNSHWLPRLQKQLLMSGYLAYAPEMPESFLPDYASWRREFERCPVSASSVLVGHSCGGGFLLRWLSENKLSVKRLVLVAPWLDPDRRKTSDFFDFVIDSGLTQRIEVHLFESSNDASEIKRSIIAIRESLPDLIYHRFENCDHFCISDPATPFFEKLKTITAGEFLVRGSS